LAPAVWASEFSSPTIAVTRKHLRAELSLCQISQGAVEAGKRQDASGTGQAYYFVTGLSRSVTNRRTIPASRTGSASPFASR
jgi:hypothetical protein